MGMARASVATTRGLGSLASNPPAIDYHPFTGSDLPFDLTASVYTYGGTIGSTFFSGSDFEQIFGTKPGGISDKDREQIGQLLQDEKLFANGAINLFTLRYRTLDGGAFGLYYGHRLYSEVNFPEGLVTLLETSNIATNRFEFTTSGVSGTWITELGVTYGKQFGSLSEPGWFPLVGVGVTAKYLQGVAHFDIGDNSILTIDPITVNDGTTSKAGFLVRGGYRFRTAEPDNFDPASAVSKFLLPLFPGTAGSGFGADAGISGVLYRRPGANADGTARDAIFFGLALMNAGSITWNTNTSERVARNLHDTLGSSAITNEQLDRYVGELTPIADFTTSMPMTFRAGIGVDLSAYSSSGTLEGDRLPLLVNIEGEVPLNHEAGNPEDPRVAVGVDWRASEEFSLRSGISIGGTNGFGFGLGAGWRPLEWLALDAGTSELNAIFNGKRVDFAIRAMVGFHRP
jgi:hypothetical protein